MTPTSANYKLIKQCKKGSSKAQFKIYNLYCKAMYNICLRFIKNTTEAEDVMQEAFLSAFKKINTCSGEVEFGAWLKKIVINKSLDYLKKRKLEISDNDSDFSNRPDSNPENGKDIASQIDSIKITLQKLPQKDQNIINLHLFEGYDHNEIAEILDMKHATVRSQYSRAKQKLLIELKQINPKTFDA